jgi:hypothetical protein
VNEYEHEPIPGLPEELPQGEQILWQGAPHWRTLARRAFHARKVAIYFGLLLLGIAVSDILAGVPLAEAALGGGWVLVLAHVAVGLLVLLAWATARATLFTVTTRRVVMRFGVAIPMTINIPFQQIASAAVKLYPDGTGDIPLSLRKRGRASYLVLWPYVRPWHFTAVEPMLRGVPDAGRVADILTAALSEAVSPRVVHAANDADGGRELAQRRVISAVRSV